MIYHINPCRFRYRCPPVKINLVEKGVRRWRRWAWFLLAVLVLVLAGWGAAADGIFGRPPLCKAKATLSHAQGEGYIYQCGGCAFVVLNDNYALLLGCKYGKQRIDGKGSDWSQP